MKVMHQYKLYKSSGYLGIYTEEQLTEKFGITANTLRFNVMNNKELDKGYYAEMTEDKILQEKIKPTDPKMIALLKEWDEVRKLFRKSSVQENENVL